MNKLSFDYSPFTKSFIGFDSMLNELITGTVSGKIPTYPPYNIKKVDENKYVIEVALAGFGKQDVEITLDNGTLNITGSISSDINNSAENYMYKGIADRAFTRTFKLADSVIVKDAHFLNGLLKVWLEKFIPEEKKPKKIPINDGDKSEKVLLTETN